MTCVLASGDARAERIVLKSGEVVEGSIIEATRNTVIIQRTIGGMRQMRIRDIEEIRFDLAQGQQIAGRFLSWADGVYEVRSGDQVVRVSESAVLSREPRQETARQLPSRPIGQQRITAAAAPSIATAEPASEGQNQSKAAADGGSDAAAADAERSAAGDAESEAVAEAETQAAAEVETQAAAEPESQAAADAGSDAAGDAESQAAADAEGQAAADTEGKAPDAESQAVAGAESRAVAGEEGTTVGDQASLAVGDQASLAVKASVDPPESGARTMVFKIELSQPADQTVVLIYGTVDGTAKAGKDYEAQQGMLTLAPGAKSAEVRVPLMEGQPENGEKRFELVLMADPKVADIVDRRVIATIKGAD